MLRATLIYNPRAGSANSASIVEQAAEAWRARGWQVSVRGTRAPNHANELASESAAAGHQLVVAAGGDGTLGEVANGLAGTETVMAPLPVGTANSFGKELGMPRPGLFNRRNILRANDLLALGSVKRVDLGRSKTGDGREHYWLLWSGTGADGYLVDQLEPRHPWLKRFGRAGYVTESLWVAPRLPPMWAKVDVDGRHFSDKYLLIVISNCRRYAGGEVVLSPGAKMDDGSFEVWLFRGEGMLEAIRHFGMTKLGRHLKDGDIIMVSGRRVSIETDPVMPCQCDGERVGVSPMQCEIVPGALRLLVPRTAPADLFEQPGAEIDELFGVNQ